MPTSTAPGTERHHKAGNHRGRAGRYRLHLHRIAVAPQHEHPAGDHHQLNNTIRLLHL